MPFSWPQCWGPLAQALGHDTSALLQRQPPAAAFINLNDDGRIFIPEPMEAFQAHGDPEPPPRWMGLGHGVQHSVTHNPTHPLAPSQGGHDGGGLEGGLWLTAIFLNTTTTYLNRLRHWPQGRQEDYDVPRLGLQGLARKP